MTIPVTMVRAVRRRRLGRRTPASGVARPRAAGRRRSDLRLQVCTRRRRGDSGLSTISWPPEFVRLSFRRSKRLHAIRRPAGESLTAWDGPSMMRLRQGLFCPALPIKPDSTNFRCPRVFLLPCRCHSRRRTVSLWRKTASPSHSTRLLPEARLRDPTIPPHVCAHVSFGLAFLLEEPRFLLYRRQI